MKNFFKISLFFVLLMLLVGVLSAVEVSDNNTEIVKKSDSLVSSSSDDSNLVVKDKDKSVKSASGKVKTRLTVNSIPDVGMDSDILVYGHLSDVNGKSIDNARVTLDVNGEDYETTTYYGDYIGEYMVTKSGKYTVKVSFKGNGKYYASSAMTSFNVPNKKSTYIYLDGVPDLKYGEFVSVSGFFSDGRGHYLRNTLLTVRINGKNYTAKTDGNGYFVRKVKANKMGKNSVKVLFKGNSKYTWTSSYLYFTVSRQSTKITCNNINTVNKGSGVKVSGRLVDAKGNPLKSASVVVKVNGVKHIVKTSNNGVYSYSFKAGKVGSNSVSVSFSGNKYYVGKSVSKTFKVKSPYKTMTLYMDQFKYIGNDEFYSWYQIYSGEFSSGVYVRVLDYYGDYGDPADNMIVGATFYFKNSKGNVISRKFDDGNGIWMGHDLINGYTPFKVVVKYRRMTQRETDLWNSGYEWDALTNSWHNIYAYY